MLDDVTTLLEAADEFYGLTLPEFTPARDVLAKSLKSTDRALSERVRSLKKPSTAAWVINLLARREPDQVDQVLQVGAALREAQASLDGEELRALTRQRRQLTAALTQQARALALEHGQRVTGAVAEQVEATLTAAMIDQAAGAAVRSGLLITAIAATGVGSLEIGPYVAVPDALGFTPDRIDPPVAQRPDLHVVPDPDEKEKKVSAARESLVSAEEGLARAQTSLDAANADFTELEAHTLQLQAEIDELRRRLGELESEQDDVDDELADARQIVASVRDDVSGAEAARTRAVATLAQLTE